MQNVVTCADQSCRMCASQASLDATPCPYADLPAEFIWREVEYQLSLLQRAWHDGGGVVKCNAQRAILNLMWHYGQRVYFESEESG